MGIRLIHTLMYPLLNIDFGVHKCVYCVFADFTCHICICTQYVCANVIHVQVPSEVCM